MQTSIAVSLAAGTVSAPRPIDFATESGLTAHALFYAPASEGFEAPNGGLDPDQWFNNVEVIASERIGQETVRYSPTFISTT